MKLTVVYDNRSADDGLEPGWGFSCLAGESVLFDTGAEYRGLKKNLEALDIDISRLKAVLLSHRHRDHTGGLAGLLEELDGRIRVYGCSDMETTVREETGRRGGEFLEALEFREISSGIYTTGEIDCEYGGGGIKEQSMAVRTGRGVAVVTGCSHPGIVEVIERAKDLFPGERITMALGGFHLKDSSEDVIYSIAGRFRELGVEKVAPAHCSGEEGMNIFSEVFKGSYISAGAGKSLEV